MHARWSRPTPAPPRALLWPGLLEQHVTPAILHRSLTSPSEGRWPLRSPPASMAATVAPSPSPGSSAPRRVHAASAEGEGDEPGSPALARASAARAPAPGASGLPRRPRRAPRRGSPPRRRPTGPLGLRGGAVCRCRGPARVATAGSAAESRPGGAPGEAPRSLECGVSIGMR
ncbi:unnamed protein product [Prorocentrum cordatum]|uniref:Uncharacterized protein n=1 Tax=Prorocentrum cordatum TaxID=2364126 RepID=A0ABN9VRC9_9DINO|nr:unnamed protein product [Polarella glacialis]